MPIPREVLDEEVARMNEARRTHERVVVERYEPPGKFTLSFPDRPLPEGQCIDQDFTEVQFALHLRHRIDTNLLGGRQDEDTRRFVVDYEVVEWD